MNYTNDGVNYINDNYAGSIHTEEIKDSIDGFQVPIDPMELLQCDSCQ